MKKLNSKGFGIIEALLLIIILAVIGFGGYYVWSNRNDKKNSLPKATSQTGGPATDHVVSTEIRLVTGVYTPNNIDIRKGSLVTWVISDGGDIPNYGVENNTDSTEIFSSSLLKTGDKFSHTFKKVGTFGWHDKYQGRLTGTVTVTE